LCAAGPDALGQVTSGVPAEQAAVGGRPVFGDVELEQFGEPRMAWDGTDFLDSAVLELAAFSAGAGAGPGAADRARRADLGQPLRPAQPPRALPAPRSYCRSMRVVSSSSRRVRWT